MPSKRNLHATALVIADRGILILGESGSGKTSLALSLIRYCLGVGVFARLIGDDQIFLDTRSGRVLARAPETIAGLIEVRGLGPRPARNESEGVIDLIVRLADAEPPPRFQECGRDTLMGVDLPCLVLPARDDGPSIHAVLVAISVPPFL